MCNLICLLPCVTHVPWCMSGSLTNGDGENVLGIPGACAPAILRIWQEAHGAIRILADETRGICRYSQTKETLAQPNQPVWVAGQMMNLMCFSRTHIVLCPHRTVFLNLSRNRLPVSLYRFNVRARSHYTGSTYLQVHFSSPNNRFAMRLH